MNNLKHLLSIAVVLFSLSLQAQDCTIVSNGGTFVYGDDSAITVTIDGVLHTETHADGFLKSTMTWTGDCSYTMTIDEVTIPDFPYGVGTQMSVVITSIEGIKVYYTSTIDGESWDSVMGKVE